MPDLADLMRDAASRAGSRPVDIEAVVRRGDRLRLQRTITRASSPVLVVLALLLVLPQVLGSNTVKFLPSDPPGAVASPPAGSADLSEAPATKSERRRLRRLNRDGTAVPVDGSGRNPTGAADRMIAGSGTAQTPSGGTTIGSGTRPGGGADDPADPPNDSGEPAPATDPLPPNDPGTKGPPQQEYCDVSYLDAPRGGSTTCKYTATHAGGFSARNGYRYVYHPNPSTAPDYWRLEIQRGSEVVRYDNHNFPSSCMDDAIRPGDIVTATVFRPNGPDDPFNMDLYTGRYRSCNT